MKEHAQKWITTGDELERISSSSMIIVDGKVEYERTCNRWDAQNDEWTRITRFMVIIDMCNRRKVARVDKNMTETTQRTENVCWKRLKCSPMYDTYWTYERMEHVIRRSTRKFSTQKGRKESDFACPMCFAMRRLVTNRWVACRAGNRAFVELQSWDT